MVEKLGIIDLLCFRGFDLNRKVKLVRHKYIRFDLHGVLNDGWMELYQSCQARPVVKDCECIISFIADGGTRARFVGVFEVQGERELRSSGIPNDSPFGEWRKRGGYYYQTVRRPEFSDFEGRTIVEWGGGTRSWVQRCRNKSIIEIYPSGRSLEPFSDYLDCSLTHRELRELVTNAEAHRDWKSSLSAVSGVYLILAETSGQQYIGSAYGLDGIWGRWSTYAKNGHGGNQFLRKLLHDNEAYPGAFRYSVLQVLPKSTTKAEVIRWESQYKIKLGSRALGLNAN